MTTINPQTKNEKSTLEMATKLPAVLRLLGSGALIFAMYSFLFQGWQEGNDVYRYLILLGHTVALSVIGLTSGHYLKEGKGARLLITLSLVSVPVNFCILGAFIYSQTGFTNMSVYPGYLSWSVKSFETAIFATAGAFLLLLPVILLGFSVLARGMSRKLTCLYLLSNGVLLMPLRDPHIISMVVLLLGIINIWGSHKVSSNQIAAKTIDGLIAIGMQFLPMLILSVRSLWLYSVDELLLAMLAMIMFIVFRQISVYLNDNERIARCMDKLSVLPAMSVVPLLSCALIINEVINVALALPFSLLIYSLMIMGIANRSRISSSYYKFAASTSMIGLLFNMLLFDGVITTLACSFSGFAYIVLSFKAKQKMLFTNGVILLLIGLLRQMIELAVHFDFTSWISLAFFGVLSIIVASVIESQKVNIKPVFERCKNAYNEWS